MKICIGVQARLSSKRFPGKVLKKIGKKTLVDFLIERLRKTILYEHIFLLTSKNKSDNLLEHHCKKQNINCFRGNLINVYDRYRVFLEQYGYDAVVRISADSPLMDFELINDMIKLFKTRKMDILTNVFPRSFPRGQSVEIISSNIIKTLSSTKLRRDEKEHVTKYFYKNYSKYKIVNIKCPYKHSEEKLSIDTINDFQKLRNFLNFKGNDKDFKISDILSYW